MGPWQIDQNFSLLISDVLKIHSKGLGRVYFQKSKIYGGFDDTDLRTPESGSAGEANFVAVDRIQNEVSCLFTYFIGF